jgi:hypothetical protein
VHDTALQIDVPEGSYAQKRITFWPVGGRAGAGGVRRGQRRFHQGGRDPGTDPRRQCGLPRDSDITHDIRVGDSRGSQDSSQLLRRTRDAGVERRYDRIFATCMKARGYSQKTS